MFSSFTMQYFSNQTINMNRGHWSKWAKIVEGSAFSIFWHGPLQTLFPFSASPGLPIGFLDSFLLWVPFFPLYYFSYVALLEVSSKQFLVEKHWLWVGSKWFLVEKTGLRQKFVDYTKEQQTNSVWVTVERDHFCLGRPGHTIWHKQNLGCDMIGTLKMESSGKNREQKQHQWITVLENKRVGEVWGRGLVNLVGREKITTLGWRMVLQKRSLLGMLPLYCQ